MEDTTLATELDRLQGMARELGACVHDQGAPPAARDLCAALAASVDRAVRLAAAGDNAGTSRNTGQRRNSSRKAAADAKVRRQVRVASAQDTRPLDDGLSWRKYGQKDILGARYPRAYFRCTHRHTRGCHATKHVQRADADPLLFHVLYNGAHTCAQQGSATSLEQQQPPVFSQPAVATEAQSIGWPEEPVTPFSFPSSPAGAIDGCYPLVSPDYGCYPVASPDYGCYDYAVTGGLGADMDLEPQLLLQIDELFFSSSELFQPEMHTAASIAQSHSY